MQSTCICPVRPNSWMKLLRNKMVYTCQTTNHAWSWKSNYAIHTILKFYIIILIGTVFNGFFLRTLLVDPIGCATIVKLNKCRFMQR